MKMNRVVFIIILVLMGCNVIKKIPDYGLSTNRNFRILNDSTFLINEYYYDSINNLGVFTPDSLNFFKCSKNSKLDGYSGEAAFIIKLNTRVDTLEIEPIFLSLYKRNELTLNDDIYECASERYLYNGEEINICNRSDSLLRDAISKILLKFDPYTDNQNSYYTSYYVCFKY
ncbi:MAG: hypothetical protein H6607_05465 [Flavobacteriales bacterium]|nr:hypothetical protein [Flavobacteriales bacterium]